MDGATHEQSTGKVLLSADASFSNQLGGLIQTELGKIGAQDNVAPTNNSRTLQTQLQNNICKPTLAKTTFAKPKKSHPQHCARQSHRWVTRGLGAPPLGKQK